MSDETVPVLPSTSDAQSPTDNINLQDMFSQFLQTSEEYQLRPQNVAADELSKRDWLSEALSHIEDDMFERKTHMDNYYEGNLFNETPYLIFRV